MGWRRLSFSEVIVTLQGRKETSAVGYGAHLQFVRVAIGVSSWYPLGSIQFVVLTIRDLLFHKINLEGGQFQA